uniref:Uncharacterized protein n=1 Tax=Oryza sativa subsp. japonica TaxID=39947 RepID=Q7EZW9_ORYSJ|nr:hypothetical protein [Oryza sativa Japonica Group]
MIVWTQKPAKIDDFHGPFSHAGPWPACENDFSQATSPSLQAVDSLTCKNTFQRIKTKPHHPQAPPLASPSGRRLFSVRHRPHKRRPRHVGAIVVAHLLPLPIGGAVVVARRREREEPNRVTVAGRGRIRMPGASRRRIHMRQRRPLQPVVEAARRRAAADPHAWGEPAADPQASAP